mmetsp:Transcript_61072/g.176968  ORF Transcript_61072/g.176968 Transcript_61072/m.176968 type:complete len:127 (+) Transcript_61072:452-832(+)
MRKRALDEVGGVTGAGSPTSLFLSPQLVAAPSGPNDPTSACAAPLLPPCECGGGLGGIMGDPLIAGRSLWPGSRPWPNNRALADGDDGGDGVGGKPSTSPWEDEADDIAPSPLEFLRASKSSLPEM